MDTQLYTIHQKKGGDEVRLVGDGKHILAFVPPIWAIWRGLWLTLIGQVAFIGFIVWLTPLAFGMGFLALVFLTITEGASMERLELRLRGWEELGVVDAASEEGAEELWRTGRAVVL